MGAGIRQSLGELVAVADLIALEVKTAGQGVGGVSKRRFERNASCRINRFVAKVERGEVIHRSLCRLERGLRSIDLENAFRGAVIGNAGGFGDLLSSPERQ